MPKYVKKKALKNAIEYCTWYHINKNGELVEGANSNEHEPLYKYSDIKKIIKGLPTKKFKNEPKQGEWACLHNGKWKCSECGIEVLIYAKGNFCPNCGADMRKGADDETMSEAQ